ncbi:uncharacterized protein HaLaN_20931, partial [Haematococcus lacustris]
LKSQLAADSMAVRQEHLALLRLLVLACPDVFPDLRDLADKDIEVDFFLNAAHLQLHRRVRALNRLARLATAAAAALSSASLDVGQSLLRVVMPWGNEPTPAQPQTRTARPMWWMRQSMR